MNTYTSIFHSQNHILDIISYTLSSYASSTATFREKKTPFHSSKTVTVSLFSYLKSNMQTYSGIINFMRCSDSCYIIALVLLDRIKSMNPIYTLTPRNVYKLFFTAVLIAVKSNDDHFFSQEYYSKVGGLKLKEISDLELLFINSLEFNIYVDSQTFENYGKKLVQLYEEENVG